MAPWVWEHVGSPGYVMGGPGQPGPVSSTQPGVHQGSLSPSIRHLPGDGMSICPEVTEPLRHRQQLQGEARVPPSKLHPPERGHISSGLASLEHSQESPRLEKSTQGPDTQSCHIPLSYSSKQNITVQKVTLLMASRRC